MSEGGWRRRSWRYLFESHWFKLRQDELTLPGGEDITYTVIEHPGYVVVVPITDDGRVVMEHVYRHTVGRTLLECPSGGLDGEDPVIAARRELEEETGYRAREVVSLGRFFGSTGISDECFHVCLATGLTDDGTVSLEPTEEIEVELMAFSELRTRALRGEIEDAASVVALLIAGESLAGQT